MYIYKRPGSKFFWYSFNYRSSRYKGSTKKTNKQDAREWASEKRKRIINESVGIFVQEAAPTFKVFAKAYLETAEVRHQQKPQTLRFYKDKLKRLLDYSVLSNARLDQIDEAMIDRYRAHRKGVVSVATCNRELATLSVVLHLAHQRKLINRIPQIAKGSEGAGRSYVLSRDNERVLLKAFKRPICDLLTVLVDTGLRVGEALHLTWDDVHFGQVSVPRSSYVSVQRGKSKNARRSVPLTARAELVLRRIQGVTGSEWVFPGRTPSEPMLVTSADHIFRKTVDGIVDGAGVRVFPGDFVLHSLRHTCLTRLGAAGVDAFTIMRIAGHSSIVVSQRYVHPTGESAQRAIASLDAANVDAENGRIEGKLPQSLPQTLAVAA